MEKNQSAFSRPEQCLAEPVMVWDQGFKEAEVSYPENPTLTLYRAVVISPNAAVY